MRSGLYLRPSAQCSFERNRIFISNRLRRYRSSGSRTDPVSFGSIESHDRIRIAAEMGT